MCRNKASISLGRDKAPKHFRHLICDDCARDYAVAIIKHIADDPEFKLKVGEAIGGDKMDKALSIRDIMARNQELESENEVLKSQLEALEELSLELEEEQTQAPMVPITGTKTPARKAAGK
jgi:hypothetical protein